MTPSIPFTVFRKFLAIAGLLLALTMIGTVGLRIIERAPWFDCLYFSIVTLTTVGYGETIPLSTAGRTFVMVFLILGLGAFTFSAFTMGQLLVSHGFVNLWERRRMNKDIDKLSGHYIVCGLGRMGTTICEYLASHQMNFVIIDKNGELFEDMDPSRNWMYIEGDATDDHVLISAGIERAQALATVLPTDADNVYVVLSARLLNAKLSIIARASDEKAIDKITRAGATRVISPFSSGAVKMARFMLHPTIEDFLEIADEYGNQLQLADVQIQAESPLVGKKLMETDLAQKGVMIIGIRRSDGQRLIPPPGSARIEVGDSLYAFGSTTAVNEMINVSDTR
ncbi:MAG: potassium channel protein [Planctomycetota bacterium]|nr:potassium channel protein [Planctomycetota bacterium]MDA1211177.1 potassium channel protein [Planctomycetota bacterium]